VYRHNDTLIGLIVLPLLTAAASRCYDRLSQQEEMLQWSPLP